MDCLFYLKTSKISSIMNFQLKTKTAITRNSKINLIFYSYGKINRSSKFFVTQKLGILLKEGTVQKLNIVSMDLILKVSSKLDDFMKNLGVKYCWVTNEEQGKRNE